MGRVFEGQRTSRGHGAGQALGTAILWELIPSLPFPNLCFLLPMLVPITKHLPPPTFFLVRINSKVHSELYRGAIRFIELPFTKWCGKSNRTPGCEPEHATEEVFVLTQLLQAEAVFLAPRSQNRPMLLQVRADGPCSPRGAFPVGIKDAFSCSERICWETTDCA